MLTSARMRILKSGLLLFFLAGLLFVVGRPHAGIPALAPLLSPFSGFWQNLPAPQVRNETLELDGMQQAAVILLDSNLVPHVQAASVHDLYFAQGYLHARFRLWQMEFLSRAAAGRLAELVGKAAVDHDRLMRRFGMRYAAENALAVVEQDSLSRQVLQAYTAGVNAFINDLHPADYPVEFKLLSAAPEPWSMLKTLLIAKLMTYDLSTLNDDYALTAILKRYGQAVVDSLFGQERFFHEPIIPSGTRWSFSPSVPEVPPVVADTSGIADMAFAAPEHGLGSNNWAVSGRLTASGLPMLCGDPHLRLSLPSLWYAMHLIGPNGWSAGASLVGTPGIIIGFNRYCSWSLTNVAPDVMDWYRIYFRDTTAAQYWYEGQYRPVRFRIEEILVRGGAKIVDTVRYTHHGPIVAWGSYVPIRPDIPRGCALRWAGHDGDNVVKAFLLLNQTRSYKDFVAAIRHFESPAQNFLYADRDGNLAVWVNGKFPLKWPQQGKFILDGRRRDHEWQGWIKHDENPHVTNVARGFLSSANQYPADEHYPYYLNWIFETGSRGYRINQRLAAMQMITPDSMRLLQMDNLNLIAQATLPVLLPLTEVRDRDPLVQQAYAALQRWNFFADSTSVAQTLFNRWWQELEQRIWSDDFPRGAFPNTETTMRLVVTGRNRAWTDRRETPQTETLADLAVAALVAAVDSLSKQAGTDMAGWAWGRIKQTTLTHGLQIPVFSRRLSTSGDKMIINATGSAMGPSWRMVVELADSIRAYWIYPGGQSGNPGSRHYDDFVEEWRTGRLRPFPLLHPEQHGQMAYQQINMKRP